MSHGVLTIKGTLSCPYGQLDHPLNLTALFGTVSLCMRDVARHYFIPQNNPLLFQNRTSCCWTILPFSVFCVGSCTWTCCMLHASFSNVQHVFRLNDQPWPALGPSHRNQWEKRWARNRINIFARIVNKGSNMFSLSIWQWLWMWSIANMTGQVRCDLGGAQRAATSSHSSRTIRSSLK